MVSQDLRSRGDFGGRTVVVSGGTSGINLGIARHFAAEGARVFVFSRSADKVSTAVAELTGIGAEAQGIAADVRDAAAVEAALAAATDRFGPIDVLVSGAAGNFGDDSANHCKSADTAVPPSIRWTHASTAFCRHDLPGEKKTHSLFV